MIDSVRCIRLTWTPRNVFIKSLLTRIACGILFSKTNKSMRQLDVQKHQRLKEGKRLSTKMHLRVQWCTFAAARKSLYLVNWQIYYITFRSVVVFIVCSFLFLRQHIVMCTSGEKTAENGVGINDELSMKILLLSALQRWHFT